MNISQILQELCAFNGNEVVKISIDGEAPFNVSLKGFGSWRGDYSDPCLYLSPDNTQPVTNSEICEALDKLISGIYYGYKGGEFSFSKKSEIRIEESSADYSGWRWVDSIDYDEGIIFNIMSE